MHWKSNSDRQQKSPSNKLDKSTTPSRESLQNCKATSCSANSQSPTLQTSQLTHSQLQSASNGNNKSITFANPIPHYSNRSNSLNKSWLRTYLNSGTSTVRLWMFCRRIHWSCLTWRRIKLPNWEGRRRCRRSMGRGWMRWWGSRRRCWRSITSSRGRCWGRRHRVGSEKGRF